MNSLKVAFIAVVTCLSSVKSQGCVCFTVSSVNIRDAPCGNVIGSGTSGQCFQQLSGSHTCTLNGVSYNWLEFSYNGRNGWSTDNDSVMRNFGSDDAPFCPKQFVDDVQGVCSNVSRVSRAEWGARDPSQPLDPLPSIPVNYVFIHHTATPECNTQTECEAAMRSIQDYHMDTNGWWDIGYNWLIGGDNQAYEGRGWPWVGAHTLGCNSNAVAVSLIGNFELSVGGTYPTDAMMQATKDIIDCGMNEGYIVDWSQVQIFGHRDSPCASTLCPGSAAYSVIQDWVWYSNSTPPCVC